MIALALRTCLLATQEEPTPGKPVALPTLFIADQFVVTPETVDGVKLRLYTDLYVQNRKPRDVVDKEDPEKGTYQHPELYNKPASMGMNYIPRQTVKGENRASRP